MHILNVKLLATRSNICIFKKVPFQMPIYGSHQAIASKIKLPPMYQQRIIYVSLNDKCGVLRASPGVTPAHDYAADLIDVRADFDSLSSVRVFSRFDYPDVSLQRIAFTDISHNGVVLDGFALFFLTQLDVFFIICRLVFQRKSRSWWTTVITSFT